MLRAGFVHATIRSDNNKTAKTNVKQMAKVLQFPTRKVENSDRKAVNHSLKMAA